MAILQWTCKSHNARVLNFLQSHSHTHKMIEGRGIAVGLLGRLGPTLAMPLHCLSHSACVYNIWRQCMQGLMQGSGG